MNKYKQFSEGFETFPSLSQDPSSTTHELIDYSYIFYKNEL